MFEALVQILIGAILVVLFIGVAALVSRAYLTRNDRRRATGGRPIYTRMEFWLTGIVLLMILCLLEPPAPSRGPPARRAICVNNLKQIGVALHCYRDEYECFPPAYTTDPKGHPLHSWRTLLLPYLEEDELYRQLRLDEPWDSDHNRDMFIERGELGRLFHCPSSEDDETITNYVMVVGPETFSDGPNGPREKDIMDGLKDTIMVVEVTGSGIHWAEPRDLDFRPMSFKINDPAGTGICSKHPGMSHAVFGDGAVHALPEDISPELLRALLTVAGGEDVVEFFVIE